MKVHELQPGCAARQEAWQACQLAITPLFGTPDLPHLPNTLLVLGKTGPGPPLVAAVALTRAHCSPASGTAPLSTGVSPGKAEKLRPLSAAVSWMVAAR